MNELPELMCLYIDSFRDDWYFKKYDVFKNIGNIKDFIEYLIDQKTCIGVHDTNDADNQLLGFCLYMDWWKTKTENKEMFDEIMKNSSKCIEIIERYSRGKILYITAIGVHSSVRRMRIGTAIVRQIVNKYSDFNIWGDVSNKYMRKVCQKFDNDAIHLEGYDNEDGYYLYKLRNAFQAAIIDRFER
jgi:hypothetical protein